MMNLIVAIGRDGSIGKDGDLIWKIPEDLKHFKTLTMGHPVIMGRKTWESLPKKPLPGRRNIILTRQKDFEADGAETVNSVQEAINATRGQDSFIIGGSEIYNAFLPYTSKLFLTVIDSTCPDADAYLNIPLDEEWQMIEQTPIAITAGGVSYRYETYRK